MDTLLLDITTWDLCADASGNIAVASDPYAVSQDVASGCRTFLNEVWYDTTLGVAYLQDILGQFPPLATVKADLAGQAELTPGCSGPVVFVTGLVGRKLTGQIQFTDDNGNLQVVSV